MTNDDAITVLCRVRGMLMQLWSMVSDKEMKTAIHETIEDIDALDALLAGGEDATD